MGEVIPLFPEAFDPAGRVAPEAFNLAGRVAPKAFDPAGRVAPQARIETQPDEAAVPSEFTPIEHASLQALGRRGMSRRELEAALRRQNYHEFAIADELDRLEGAGLIDDYAFAQHLVAHLQERKGLTGGAIKAELVRHVVAPGAIEYAMDLIDTADELARARELAAKRARQYGALDAVTVERRLTAFLLRRGFSATTVRAAVDSVRTA